MTSAERDITIRGILVMTAGAAWGRLWTWIAQKILPVGADKSAQVVLGIILAVAVLVLILRWRRDRPRAFATTEPTFYPQQKLSVYIDGKEVSVDVGQCSSYQAAQRVVDAINAGIPHRQQTADVVTLTSKHKGAFE